MSARFSASAASTPRPQAEAQFLKQVLGQLRKGDVASVRRAEGSIEARIRQLETSAVKPLCREDRCGVMGGGSSLPAE